MKTFTPQNSQTIFGVIRDTLWDYPYVIYYIFSKLRKLRVLTVILAVFIVLGLFYHFLFQLAVISGRGMGKDVLYLGIVDNKGVYNPLGNGNLSKTINKLVFNDLFSLDSNGTPSPELAKSWDINSNQTNITFHLATTSWQDGKPFTADDVLYSYNLEKKLNPDGPLSKISVQKLDKNTIVVSTQGLDLSIWEDLHWPIFPSHTIYSTDEAIGTGPYIFQKASGHVFTFISNPNYLYSNPKIKEISLTVYPDSSSLMQSYEDGEVMVAEIFDPNEDTANILLNSNKEGIYTRTLDNTYSALFFNTNSITNVKIRQGISYAINKNEISDLLGSYITLIDGPISTHSWAYDPSTSINRYPYSEANALASFKSAGVNFVNDKLVDSNGNQLTLTIDYDLSSTNLSVVYALKAQLEKIGIAVNLNPDDSATWKDNVLNKKNYQVAFAQVEGGIDPDPSGLWSSNAQSNISNYENKTVDEYLDLAKNVIDRDKRSHAYASFQEAIMNDAPAAFLYSPNVVLVTKPYITIQMPNTIGFEEDIYNDVQYWRI